MGLVIGGIVALFAVIGAGVGAAASGEAGPLVGIFFGVGAVVVLPVFYGAIGFVGGLIHALIYNLAAGFVGGLELDVE